MSDDALKPGDRVLVEARFEHHVHGHVDKARIYIEDQDHDAIVPLSAVHPLPDDAPKDVAGRAEQFAPVAADARFGSSGPEAATRATTGGDAHAVSADPLQVTAAPAAGATGPSPSPDEVAALVRVARKSAEGLRDVGTLYTADGHRRIFNLSALAVERAADALEAVSRERDALQRDLNQRDEDAERINELELERDALRQQEAQ